LGVIALQCLNPHFFFVFDQCEFSLRLVPLARHETKGGIGEIGCRAGVELFKTAAYAPHQLPTPRVVVSNRLLLQLPIRLFLEIGKGVVFEWRG
jgi:hypothetical protein